MAPAFFEAFARRAECEVRPVEELVVEVLSNYARHLQQCDLADAYGDAKPTTPAMDLARIQSDARESGIDHGYEPDAYEFYLEHSAPVELALALH